MKPDTISQKGLIVTMKKRHSIIATVSAAMLISILCISVTAADIPEPSDKFYVYDEAGVISDETEDHIVSQNDKLYSSTGAQIVIAAVKTTGEEAIRTYAGEMYTKWGIGDADKNNGVLVLLAIDDSDYWVTQGKGIEDKLTSGDIKILLDKYLEPSFALQDYDGGAKALFDKLISTFENIYGQNLDEVTVPPEGVNPNKLNASAGSNLASSVLTGFIIVVVVAVFIVIIAAVLRPRYRRGPRRPTVIIPPRNVRPPYRRPSPGPRPRPGQRSPRSGMGPSGMGGFGPGSRPAPRPSSRPSGMSRPGGTPRSGGGGSTRGGGAGRR